MKHTTKYMFGVVVLAVVAIGAILVAQKSDQLSEHAQSMQFNRIRQTMDGGALLMDVRTPEEYAAGHIAGADNVPLQEIQSGIFSDGDTSRKIYVYCRSGNRSAQAAVLLRKIGYVVEDLGGVEDVAAMGGEIVR